VCCYTLHHMMRVEKYNIYIYICRYDDDGSSISRVFKKKKLNGIYGFHGTILIQIKMSERNLYIYIVHNFISFIIMFILVNISSTVVHN
jgi:hypothetical protein